MKKKINNIYTEQYLIITHKKNNIILNNLYTIFFIRTDVLFTLPFGNINPS